MPGQFDSIFTWRKLALSVLFAIVFLATGWSIFWYVAHRLALRELQETLGQEARAGRTWTCKSISSGGYPFSININCDGFSVTADAERGAIVAHARAASVRAPLHSLKRVTVNVESPADVEIPGVVPLVGLEWKTLQFSARGLPDRLDRLSASGSDLSIRIGDAPTSQVALFQSNVRRAPGASDGAFNFEFSIGGIRSRILDLAIGGEQLALLAGVGSVTQVDRGAAGSLPERMERWRIVGGRAVVNQLTLLKGDFAIQAEGAIGLDPAHRPEGKIDLRIQNAADRISGLARNLGVAGPIAGALLGGLLPMDRQTGELRLQASLDNGQLGIGPFKALVALPPLY